MTGFTAELAELRTVEGMLLIRLCDQAAKLLDSSAESLALVESAGLDMRDFVWSDVSGVFDRLREVTIEWPALIDDESVMRFYQTISYIKAVIHHSRSDV